MRLETAYTLDQPHHVLRDETGAGLHPGPASPCPQAVVVVISQLPTTFTPDHYLTFHFS